MRYTTKETLSIETKFLNSHHCFEHDFRSARFECFWIRNGQEAKSIVNFEMSTVVGDRYIHFLDLETDEHPGIKTNLDCIAKLDYTTCHFGGRRWWFICPMVTNGQACNRRVGVLYLPSGRVFGCRHCHNIAYQRSKKGYK